MFRKNLFNRRLFLSLLASTPLTVYAQNFPSKPLKLIVPYAAGGGTDAIARLVAQAVSESLGQTLVVENNGAAGGNIATGQAAKADIDGYTVLMANQGPMVVNPHLFKNLTTDPLTAFDPVILIAETPLVLVVPNASPFKSMSDLLKALKENPAKLNYGSAGNGSAGHLATELLLFETKLKATHIPYRGAAPALNDIVGGRLDFMITTLPSIQGQLDGGLVRGLAVTVNERTARFKDIPAYPEFGIKESSTGAWYGFVVPKGTPETLIEILRQATLKALNAPALKTRLEGEGAKILGSDGKAFKTMMEAESTRWKNVISALGLTF